MADFIQTVLGKINSKDIERTLTHEHFFIDYTNFYISPPSEIKQFLEGEINLQNLGFVQRYPYSSKSNVSFFTEDLKAAVLNDVKIFRQFGGSAIVENTSHGLKRNISFLKEISEKTGIHVIAGTGYYLASVQPHAVLTKTTEELYEVMKTDLLLGCPELPQVKCGIIGEVASDFPIHSFEIKAIQATGILQEEIKCPVSFHPGRDSKAPSEIMRLYMEAGGNPYKAVMCHLDRTLQDCESLLNFASENKCFLQYDLFGTELLTYQFDPKFHMPSDMKRLKRIKSLIHNGYLQRILISQDIHTKHRLAGYGGHGYFHLLCNIIPKMQDLGITQNAIDEITINNPRKWLTWNLA